MSAMYSLECLFWEQWAFGAISAFFVVLLSHKWAIGPKGRLSAIGVSEQWHGKSTASDSLSSRLLYCRGLPYNIVLNY